MSMKENVIYYLEANQWSDKAKKHIRDLYDKYVYLVDEHEQQEQEKMGNTLAKAAEPIVVAEIVHAGDKLILPTGVSLQQAKDLIVRRMQYEQEEVALSETFDVFPYDGANALDIVLTDTYGWSPAQATPSMWGPTPPRMISIDIDYDQKRSVPWGQFSLPNVTGTINTSAAKVGGVWKFQITANVLRMDEGSVKTLFAKIRTFLKTGSIYQGKAIKVRFCNDKGKLLDMPEPKFMRTNDVDETALIFSKDVMNAVQTNLFTPIQRIHDLQANNIPVKRGVLLGGVFGTGKTLAAKVASKYAVQHGLTFLYVGRADELKEALGFAKQYQSPGCVVFCEDIDRAVDGERTVALDDILNIMDGIDTKSANIITVLTTNNLKGVNKAMLRPGRLDSVIEVKAPDAEAVQRLLRSYGGDAIQMDEDLTEVGEVLDGHIPAVIAEVVKRAKLSQLGLNPPGVPVTHLSSDALLEAATTMSMQLQLLKPDDYKEEDTLGDSVASIIRKEVSALRNDLNDDLEGVKAYCS